VAKLLDQVPTDRVIQALHGAEPRLSRLILSSLAARARRMIEHEQASGATPSARDINKARRAIADLALELADRGTIELHAEEEGDVEVV
jgi:flagellar motor switch protein FliG